MLKSPLCDRVRESVCRREGKGKYCLCFYSVYISLYFYVLHSSFASSREVEKKKRGRVREYSQFPSKKKIHLQLLM